MPPGRLWEAAYAPSMVRWRVGRKIGRTIYLQLGDEPTDGDPLIGLMDTPALAMIAVTAVNEMGRGH